VNQPLERVTERVGSGLTLKYLTNLRFNTLAYLVEAPVTNKKVFNIGTWSLFFKPFFFVTDSPGKYARVVVPGKLFVSKGKKGFSCGGVYTLVLGFWSCPQISDQADKACQRQTR
jgi:hypothetical protein